KRAQFLRLSNPMDDARVTADMIRDTTNSHSRCSNRKAAPGGMSEGSGPVSMSIPAEGKTTKTRTVCSSVISVANAEATIRIHATTVTKVERSVGWFMEALPKAMLSTPASAD